MSVPHILVEDDRPLRLLQLVLDPETQAERRAAWADFVAHDLPDFDGWVTALRARLSGLYPARFTFVSDQEAFDAALPEADAVVMEGFTFGAAQLARAPGLKLLQKFGTVTGNIDLAAAAARSLPVEVLRRRTNVCVAEHAFALMIASARRLPEVSGLVTAEALRGAGFDPTPFDRRYATNANFGRVPRLKALAGSTVGVLGLGEIGRELATRAKAFGMEVLYHQRNRLPPGEEARMGARMVGLAELFQASDFVSIHLPLNDSTRGIVGAAVLEGARPGLILVNSARADLVDRAALLAALDAGRLGAFALDTGYTEPAAADDPLLGRPNVLLTPHTAPANRLNGLNDAAEICENLRRALA